jgi:hypothetical protein
VTKTSALKLGESHARNNPFSATGGSFFFHLSAVTDKHIAEVQHPGTRFDAVAVPPL